jgi:hypothetical protein
MAEDNDPPAPPHRSGPEERDYLLARAAEHRDHAENSTRHEAKSIHLALAQLYAQRAADVIVVDTD